MILFSQIKSTIKVIVLMFFLMSCHLMSNSKAKPQVTGSIHVQRILDQGGFGSCTAMAFTSWLESVFSQKMSSKVSINSDIFVYQLMYENILNKYILNALYNRENKINFKEIDISDTKMSEVNIIPKYIRIPLALNADFGWPKALDILKKKKYGDHLKEKK